MFFLFFNFLATAVFFLGFCGIFLNNKNILLIIMSIELTLLSINFNFLVLSCFLDDIIGQIFTIFILTIAAAETSIGLAILVIYYRLRGSITVDFILLLKG